MLAIPADAPHKDAALAFIDFVLRPEVMAGITNVTHYPNAVPATGPLLTDASVIPSDAEMARLFHHRPGPSGGGAGPHAAVGAVQGGQLNEILRIEGLTVRFGAVTALDSLDLTVRRGELFVLLAVPVRARRRCCARSAVSFGRRPGRSRWTAPIWRAFRRTAGR